MVRLINCGLIYLSEECRRKKMYCFGAGKQFRIFLEENSDIRIDGIIDNYVFGQKINVHEKIMEIISLETFVDVFRNDAVVLITCSAYVDIIAQMDQIQKLDGMICFLDLFLREYTEHFRRFPVLGRTEYRIPKKIHYCWFGGGEMPSEYKRYIETWRKHCPDYEIICWDESNYDISKNKFMREAYEHKKWAFVSDYARVDVIHKYGGIYLDTDVELLKPLDGFLGWDMFCGFESLTHVAWGLGFGAVKGFPVLKDVLDRYENMAFVKEDGTLNMISCPIIQSEVMEQHGFLMNGMPQEADNIAIYPKEFFSPYSFMKEFGRITDNTHSIHHYSASWMDGKPVKSIWTELLKRANEK